MDLPRRQVPRLRLAMSRDGSHARLRLVAFVEEVVHVAVGPLAMGVGQPGELGVEFHIRLGQRRDHRWCNVAGTLNQRGEAQVRLLLRVHERLIQDQARGLAHEDHLAALSGELAQPIEAGPRDHCHRRQHDGLVRLAAKVGKAAVRESGDGTERLLIEVVPVNLVLEQLPAQLGGAAVGILSVLAAQPYGVARMVESYLRRRASDCHQVAHAVGVPRNHRSLWRHRRGRGCRRVGAGALEACQRNPDLQRVHSAHRLKVQLILAVDAHAAAFFRPDFGLAEEMRRRRRQLGKVIVD